MNPIPETPEPLLEKVKDDLANENYSVPSWTLLDDSQRAALVDLVAVIYHSNLKGS